MKVYSDILTEQDLRDALPRGISMDVQRIPRARKRTNGWTVYLRSWGSNRWTNSGTHGAGEQGAASYDDHGRWMFPLFEKDPDAIISNWDGRADFERGTDGAYTREVQR